MFNKKNSTNEMMDKVDLEIAKAMYDLTVRINETDVLDPEYAELQKKLEVYQDYMKNRFKKVDKTTIIEKVSVEAIKVIGIIVAVVLVTEIQNSEGFIKTKEVFPLMNKMV